MRTKQFVLINDRFLRRLLPQLCLAVVTFGFSLNVIAVERVWTGQSNSDWYNPLNWSPLGGPLEDDQLSLFQGTISGSQSPVVRDGGSILLSGESVSVSFPALWFLNVGETGTGMVTVRNGADLTSFNVTMIADEAGSDGDLFVQGSGSTLTTDRLWVGVNGLGRMEITDGAYVQSDEGVIALNSGASGSSALVSGVGSTWDMGTEPLRTSGGLGYLNVEAGGTVLSGTGRIGVNGGRGEILVTGQDSKWMMSGAVDVGYYGAGSLHVEAGGKVSAANLGVHSLTFLGQGTSEIVVDGNGSLLDIQGDANVGQGYGISNDGPATVSIGNSGAMKVGGTLKLYGPGTLNVNSGGALYADVLDRSTGSLTLASGSHLYANQLVGFGSTISIGGNLTFGHSGGTANLSLGAGQLLFVNRGLVVGLDAGSSSQITATGGTIDTAIGSVAAFPDSVGQVTLNGGSRWLNVDLIQVGLFGTGTIDVAGGLLRTSKLLLSQAGGQGEVNVSAGGTVEVFNMLDVGEGGAFNLMSGTLDANAVVVNALGDFGFTGGRLEVSSFDGTLVQEDGTLAAGNSPGTMTVTADYHFNGGILEVELAGILQGSQHDFYAVAGNVSLLGGALEVSLLDGFTLQGDQEFEILSVGGSLTGTFDGLPEGAIVDTFAEVPLYITYQAGDGNDVALVTSLPGVRGDFDDDQDVDAHDFLRWQRDDGSTAGLADWESNYGLPASGALADSASVPEPASALLLLGALFCLAGNLRTRS